MGISTDCSTFYNFDHNYSLLIFPCLVVYATKGYSLDSDIDDVYWLNWHYTHKDYEGKGIGGKLLELIESAPRISWHNRKYGVNALVAMGKKGKAIKYAKASCGLNDNPAEIDRVCEEILHSSGLYDEAYQQYGLAANLGGTNLATFRHIAKKYPMKEKSQILQDLIKSTPGAEGNQRHLSEHYTGVGDNTIISVY